MATLALSAMPLLAPGRDHHVLADAITARVEAEAPLFKDDADKRRTTAYLVAVAYREGSLFPDIVGDCTEGGKAVSVDGVWKCSGGRPRSFCTFQSHETSGGTKALLADVNACVGKGFAMLRTSMKICPEHPMAWYAAGGVSACTNARAQRLARDRLALAAWVLRTVPK